MIRGVNESYKNVFGLRFLLTPHFFIWFVE
jgi:hypothetical protein